MFLFSGYYYFVTLKYLNSDLYDYIRGEMLLQRSLTYILLHAYMEM